MTLLEVGLGELQLDRCEFASENLYKEMARTACWLQETGVDTLGFSFD
jgi:hypothetical protein